MLSEDGHFVKKISCNKPIVIYPNDYIIIDSDHMFTVFSPTHQLITKFGTKGNQRGQFNDINGIAVNSVGTIFVSESDNHRLQIIIT